MDREIVTMATGWRYTFDNLPTDDGYGHNYTYAVREEGVKGYFPTYDGYDIVNKPIGKVDGRFGSSGSGQGGGATGEPGTTDELIEELKRHWTGTPLPWFWRLTDAQLEALLLLFDYRVPSWGKLFGTGDELPLYPFIFGGAGVLAVALLVALGRGKKKRRRRR